MSFEDYSEKNVPCNGKKQWKMKRWEKTKEGSGK